MSEETATADEASEAVRPISCGALVFYGICRVFAVGLSRLYYPGRVVGGEHLPKSGPYIVAPVHRSYIDWLLAARITRRRLRYIVKGEVWKVRSVGRFIELLGAFPVYRGTPDRVAMRRSLEILQAGEPLVVFPEGTRKAGSEVTEILEGAAYLALHANVPVVPIGISGAERAMPRGAKVPRPARVRIVVGPQVLPNLPTGEGSAKQQRIPRSAIRAMSVELRHAMQDVFSQAESLHGAGG